MDTDATISLVSKDQWQPRKLGGTSLSSSDILAEAASNSHAYWGFGQNHQECAI